MKVQCDGCERAEAVVVCCADEAALCRECDIQVHDANKLAGKHQRVPLFRPASTTLCDICQEKAAYFFCLEDRALLCHNCDMSIHRLTASTSNHRRFLVTGVAASLHTLSGQAAAAGPGTPPMSKPPSSSHRRKAPAQQHQQQQIKEVVPTTSSTVTSTTKNTSLEAETSRKTSIFEFLTEAVPGWKCDDLLNCMGDFNNLQPGPAASNPFKQQQVVDHTNSCSSESQFYSRSVPQMSSLPTATKNTETSWLMKPRTKQDIFSGLPAGGEALDDAFVVPDLGLHSAPELPPVMKKRRAYFSELDNIFLS